MNPQRFRKQMQSELTMMLREGLIDRNRYDILIDRYSTAPWDWTSLARWFTVFGSICAVIGAGLWVREIFEFTLEKLAILLSITIGGLFWGAWVLKRKPMTWTSRSLELSAAMAIIGLTFTLGIIYSSGSGNWPMLLLINLIVLLPLAYLLHNVLILVLCAVVFFTWFGGMTGYVSGWGAYWFGMNYPMRFLLVGILIAIIGLLHRKAESGLLKQYRDFFKVWLSAGVFFSEMALWLMSLFGNFNTIFSRYLETAAELVFFNILWAGFNVGLLVLGSRFGHRMLRAYAVTFLIIQGYTIYFWKIAKHMDPILATFLAGTITLWGVWQIESKRRKNEPSLEG